MKIILTVLFLSFFGTNLIGQNIVEHYTPQKDSLRIGTGKGDFLPYTDKGYTLILPDSARPVVGVIVSLDDVRGAAYKDPKQQIHQQANAKGLAVLYIATGVPVDLYFSQRSLLYTDSVMKKVFTEYRLPHKNIFLLGVNLAGHRALKFIQFLKQGKASSSWNIKGVVLCDGVLDWVRQWYEGRKAIRDKYAESSVFEGKLVTYLLEKHLGATPGNGLEKYLQFSTYSYFDERNRHIPYYKDLSVRAYTEPATHYWMEAKRKTTWDTNFPDQVGIINELKLAGNTSSELHVFTQDKANMDRRNPNYTWGLVDKAELVEWMVQQIR